MKVFFIGFMGSGKNYWANQLSTSLNLKHIDLDDYIEEKENCSIAEIFDKKGEYYFRKIEQQYLIEISKLKSDLIISCGGGTPCFFENINLIHENGISIYLNISFEICWERLLNQNTHSRPLVNQYSKIELKQLYQLRKKFYTQATFSFTTTNLSLENLIKTIYHD